MNKYIISLGIGQTLFVLLVVLKLMNLVNIGWGIIIMSFLWAPILVTSIMCLCIMFWMLFILLLATLFS